LWPGNTAGNKLYQLTDSDQPNPSKRRLAMLILTCRSGETLIIDTAGEQIEVTVLEVNRN
jgi:hypothetical protein